jgi:hypothetical protein
VKGTNRAQSYALTERSLKDLLTLSPSLNAY